MSIELTRKQNEYIVNANARWNFKVGAIRSGKSYVDIAFVIPERIRAVSGESGLNVILGVTKSTIERNVLEPMREIFGSDIASTINSQNIAVIAGEPVYCIGAETIKQVSKIQGASFKYCYGDEVAKWNEQVFNVVKGRMDKEYSRFDGSLNPESPGHWLKSFLESEGLDAYIQNYTIFDNPHLPPRFVENICKEYEGTVYYGRFILGEWTLAEGLIYPMYEQAIKEPPERYAEEYCVSLDYGTQNAFSAKLWAKFGNVWYAVSEYYYSGRDTGASKTDEEYANDLERWLVEYFGGMKDEQGEPRKVPYPIQVIVDPSAASFIEALRRRKTADGFGRMYRVTQADNAVSDGIRNTATAMSRGLIKFAPTLKAWKTEVQGYVWDESALEDRPIKVNDHSMDDMRYFVQTKRLIQKDDKRRNRELRGIEV